MLDSLFALWRILVSQRQADTAQQAMLVNRYQHGVSMLGDDQLAIRLGGIDALIDLAKNHPEQYHIQVNRLLCNFVPKTIDRQDDARSMTDHELQRLIDAIGTRTSNHIRIEGRAGYCPNLRNADLRGILIKSANLSKADLTDADLSNAHLLGATLSGANLSSAQLANARLEGVDMSGVATLYAADLSGASLYLVNLSEALLIGVKLTGTHFTQVVGLTRRQLAGVAFDLENPPVFNAVVDTNTGEQIDRLPNFSRL